MKWMIVDDHVGIRSMIRQIVAAPADLVCECADGEDAVRWAGEFAPDWVTMDVRMSGMDGIAATRKILAAHPAARVVIVTAHDEPLLRRAAAEAGACGYFPKDDLGELKVLRRGAGRSAAADLGRFVLTRPARAPGPTDLELNQRASLSALGLLAGGIAHDFNNILTAIRQHVAVAQEDAKEPTVQAAFGQVELAAGRAAQLALQILKFVDGENAARQRIRLPTLVADVLALLKPTWPAGVEVVADLPPAGGWISASPIQIHQVLTNVFMNAAHAMESGAGRLEVRVVSLAVARAYAEPHRDLDRGDYVELSVTDTGHGMDEATQRRIFEPFFTTKRRGTGLGLAVVHQIIKEHGAWIRVTSEVGRGTSFRLFFQACPEA